MINLRNGVNLVLATILSVIPILLIKKYVDTGENNYGYLYVAIIFSIILLLIYIELLKAFGATMLFNMVKILSILLMVFIGITYLGESLNHKQIMGVVLAIVALYLLCSK